jgi:hypothetical protein
MKKKDRYMTIVVSHSETPLATEQAHVGILAEALLELRELSVSGSEDMGIIDEALGKVGITPWKARHPDCSGRGTVHTIDDEVCDHCRNCGDVKTDPAGLCEICLKCSFCCEDGTFRSGKEVRVDFLMMLKTNSNRAMCSQCKAPVYYCPDPACKCAHHCSDTFPGYDEVVECSMSDIPPEMVIVLTNRNTH